MSELTREQILNINDQKTKKVSVPEWGDDAFVYIRTLNGIERDWFESTAKKIHDCKATPEESSTFRSTFARLIISDANGNKIFKMEDIPALGKKSAAALERILVAGLEFSLLTEDSHNEAKDFLLSQDQNAYGLD